MLFLAILFSLFLNPTAEASVASLKVSAVQYEMVGGSQWTGFESKVERLVREAATQGSELIVFPELFSMELMATGSDSNTEAEVSDLADRFPQIKSLFERLSRRYNINIQGGSSPRHVEGRIRNTAVLTLTDGRTILQDKIFLTPWERDMGWDSGTALKSIETPWGKTVILICHDSEFPIITQLLAKETPTLILVPSMTDNKDGFRRVRWTSQARAIEHKAYVIHTGTIGRPFSGWTNYGQASVLTPSTTGFLGVQKEGTANRFETIHTELDFELLESSRAGVGVYPGKQQEQENKKIDVQTCRGVFGG